MNNDIGEEALEVSSFGIEEEYLLCYYALCDCIRKAISARRAIYFYIFEEKYYEKHEKSNEPYACSSNVNCTCSMW